MKRLIAVIVATVSALLVAGGTGAAPPSTVSRYDTVMDYGQSVRISGTPEICGLSQAPTQVKIGNKAWTKEEMSPVFFCWTSKTGKPVVGAQVATAYLVRGDVVVLLANWQKRGTKLVLNLIGKLWTTVKSPDVAQIPVEMGFRDVLLSPDQLAGKVRKITYVMGRRIVPRDARVARVFGCNVQSDLLVQCGRAGVWNEWSPAFWVSPPWRTQDVQVYYENPTCGCQTQVAYDPSGISG